MKVKSLLTMALLAVSAMAFAQKDITDTYITNAGLEGNLDGWTSVTFNNPTKQANSGYAAEAYAGWGSLEVTNYSLTQEITLPKGKYRIQGDAFFRQGQAFDTNKTKSIAVMKVGDQEIALKTLGSITAKQYANSQTEAAGVLSAGLYPNVIDFEITEDSKTIEIGYVGTFDEMRSWCLVGGFHLYDLNQDPTNYDYTAKVANSSFENGTQGWTIEGAWGEQNNGEAVKVGTRYVEKWQATGGLPDGMVSQVVTGLPNGTYIVTAVALAKGTGAYVFANDQRVEAGEDATIISVEAPVTDGTLTIGFVRENTTANWVGVDNFHIYCKELDLEALKDALANIIDEVNAFLADNEDNSAMRETIASALQEAIDAAAVSETPSSRELLQKSEDLSAALEAAKASLAYYAAVENALYDAMETFEYDVETGAFMEYLEEFLDNYYAGTLVEDGSYVAEIAAARAYARKQVTEAGADMTITIVNPEVNGANGWTCEKPNGGNGPLLNGTAFEYWGGNATSRDEAKFDYYQVIEGLPNGTYLLSAEMYNSLNGEEGAEFAPTCGLYGFSGTNYEEVRVDVDSDQLSPYRLTIDVTDNTLRLGVSSFERMAARWFVADNFHLILVKPAADIEIALPTVEATTEAITLTFDLAEAVEGVENPTFEGTMLLETADGNVYMGGFNETDVVDGKVVVEVPTFVFFNMADYSPMSLNVDDEITISFPGVTLYENFTAGGYETLFEGELEGTVKATVGVVDAIKGITVSNVKVQYNLAGQRVNNAKGIVIENGKKVVK